MFYIIKGKNAEVIELNSIKTSIKPPKYYDGDNVIKKRLAEAWQMVDEKFLSKDEPVVFTTPTIMSGVGKGNQGYLAPRILDVKTNKGVVRVAWCDSIDESNGKLVYHPTHLDVNPSLKTMELGESDIEKILFMICFNPFVVTAGNPITKLVDKEKEAEQFQEKEESAGVINYWLFNNYSKLYNSEPLIETLCSVWGIAQAGKYTLARKKQMLAEAVRAADKRGDLEYNLKAFDTFCRKLEEGSDTKEVETLAIIQKCVDKKIIAYKGTPDFKWFLLGEDGKSLKTLCKVPPQEEKFNRKVLKVHLLRTSDDMEILEAALGMIKGADEEEKVLILRKVLPPEGEITAQFLENEIDRFDAMKLYWYFIGAPGTKSKAEMLPELIQLMVIEKKYPSKWELKEK